MITLKNERTGQIRRVPEGFSWTTLFFGIFVPLFRGDWKYFFITMLLALFTFGLSWFVIPFFYNRWYQKELFDNGFIIIDSIKEFTPKEEVAA